MSPLSASTAMPWAGPVRIISPDGSVRVERAYTYAERRGMTHHSSRQVLNRQDKDRILKRDGYRCQQCGSEKGPFHVDHIRPFSKGGWQDDRNLQTLCVPCNLKKGATWERSRF